MKKILLYIFWLKKKLGINTVDFEERCGYFLPEGTRKGRLVYFPSHNGKILLYRVVEIEFYRDPYDMIKFCKFSLVGMKGEKEIKECSFKEFLTIYEP